MKKVLSSTLVSLALAALAAPAFAGQFEVSVRGDVGATGSQVPYFASTSGPSAAPTITRTTHTNYSDRKEWEFDFTGRLVWYTSCAPCGTYIAGSWQGSNHTVHSALPPATVVAAGPTGLTPQIYVRAPAPTIIGLAAGDTAVASVDVRNEFSKAKVGMGFDLIKTNCFAFTMEAGGNYLNAKLDTDKRYAIAVTDASAAVPVVPTALNTAAAAAAAVPATFVFNIAENERTEGFGLYAAFKGEYKLPASCLGDCFSVYAKAEIADVIGRQTYDYNFNYQQKFNAQNLATTTGDVVSFRETSDSRYNNIVEVDLEAALVYAPCFKCWDNLNMTFALGVRTDSFVNLFVHPTDNNHQSIMSLARPTVFLEVGIKV